MESMIAVLPHILIPMIISNVLHMFIVKKKHFSTLAKPIAPTLFGKNKTWRGFVVVPFLNAFFLLLVNLFLPLFSIGEALKLGFLIGLTYMIMELPNSWIKRQSGIPSGQKASKNAWAFMLMDKMDSSLGVAFGCMAYFNWSWLVTLIFFAIAVGTHVFFSWLLVALKIKKRF
jgi:CDP-diacylglycerol--serine O-phosphatidyltransferase